MYKMFCYYTLILLLLLQVFYSSCYIRDFRTFNKNVSQTLDNLLANNRYDKRIRPDIGGPPTVVTVNMYIKSIGPISEIEQMYTMDVYFRQTWYDRRLSFDLPGLSEFSMSWLFLDKVWKPDTYFTNGKKSYLHRITSPNKFLRVRNDGFLMYSMRLTISATCQMFLKKFPMDTQRCPLQMGSYGYTKSDVLYVWSQGGVGIEPGMELAQFDLVNVTTKDNIIDVRGIMEFSVIKATFILKRNLGYFVLQMYVPCILMVCSSWVNFWIDPDATPARVQLSVTSVLSITTLGFVGRSALPKVPYPTALDWFVILCYVFVFGVMLQFAVINYIDKVTEDIKKILQDREKKKKEQEEEKIKAITAALPDTESDLTTTLDDTKSDLKKEFDVSHLHPYVDTCAVGLNLKVPVPTITVQSDTVSTVDPVQPVTRHIIEQGSINIDLDMADFEMIDKLDDDFDDSISRRTVASSRISRRTFCVPFRILKEVKILPTEKEVSESKGEKEKFTKIDTRSRIIFPLFFTFVMCFYVLFYTYVVQDNTDFIE